MQNRHPNLKDFSYDSFSTEVKNIEETSKSNTERLKRLRTLVNDTENLMFPDRLGNNSKFFNRYSSKRTVDQYQSMKNEFLEKLKTETTEIKREVPLRSSSGSSGIYGPTN